MTLNRLKVTLNRTTRLVPVNDYSWNYLQSILRERFSLSPETSLQLTYLDHDGDNITIVRYSLSRARMGWQDLTDLIATVV